METSSYKTGYQNCLEIIHDDEKEIALLTRRNDRMRAALIWIVRNAREAGCNAVIDEAENALLFPLDGE